MQTATCPLRWERGAALLLAGLLHNGPTIINSAAVCPLDATRLTSLWCYRASTCRSDVCTPAAAASSVPRHDMSMQQEAEAEKAWAEAGYGGVCVFAFVAYIFPPWAMYIPQPSASGYTAACATASTKP